MKWVRPCSTVPCILNQEHPARYLAELRQNFNHFTGVDYDAKTETKGDLPRE